MHEAFDDLKPYTASFLLFCKNNNYVPTDAMFHAWNHASYHRPAVRDAELERGRELVKLLHRERANVRAPGIVLVQCSRPLAVVTPAP